MSVQLDNFYRQVFAVLCRGLARLAKLEADKLSVLRGASLMLPLINGYGLVAGSLALDVDQMAGELAAWVWDILTTKADTQT